MQVGSSSLKIIHIVSGDLWAGAEVQVFQLCCALNSWTGVEVSAITFNAGLLETRLRQALIPVHVIDETKQSPLSMVRAIIRILRQEQPAVIHTHGQKENILGTIAALAARVPKSVRTVHGNSENHFSLRHLHKPILNVIDMLAGRFCQDSVVAVSEQLKLKLDSVFPGKVLKINNFIDIEKLRSEYPLNQPKQPREPFHIGLVGRLVPVKRADLFIDSLETLRREYGLEFKASIIGDGPLKPHLMDQVRRYGLIDSIDFLGFLDPVYPALAALDLLVITSDHEGLPMIVIEAQALEVPILAHAIGGIPDALADGHAGNLVTDHSAKGYAGAIAELVMSGSANKTLEFALEHAKAEFGWQANSDRYLKLYTSLY